MNLFFGLFGWRKATKCKRLIKRVQCRVKLLKNKRESIIRHLKEDVVQLLKAGEDQRAFLRVDQLSKDQNIVAAYDLLDHFCEFVLINLPYIRQHKDCPNDINEAVSSLLYASARCGDLPELIELRKLFGRRYGKPFAVGAVELLPGNLVNRQVIEKLTVKSVSHEVKFRLMNQIAIDNGLELGPPEIDCKLQLQQDKVYDLSLVIYDFDSDKKVTGVVESLSSNQMNNAASLVIYDFDSEKKVTNVVETLSSNQINNAAKVEKPKDLDHLYEPEIILHRFSGQSYPGVSSSSRVSSASIQHKTESITEPASEYSFQISERNIVYLDDVEEFKVQPRVQEDTKDKDQRLFMFKSTFTPPQGDTIASLSDLNNDLDLYTDGRTSSQNTAKKRKSTKRRLKRRHTQIENQMSSCSTSTSLSIKDMESEMYYKNELNRRPHHPKKHQREMSIKQERLVSSKTSHRKKSTSTKHCEQPEELYSENGLPQRSKCSFNCDMKDNCCLESPCYFVTSEDRDDCYCPTPRSSVSQSHKLKTRRKVHRKKQRNEVESCASSSSSRLRKTNPVTRPPYLRTSMTMPPRERPKDIVPSNQLVKFASCEFPQKSTTNHSNGSSSSSCRHIHPKLPDYDELAARFTALKEDYMRSSRSEFSHGSSRS